MTVNNLIELLKNLDGDGEIININIDGSTYTISDKAELGVHYDVNYSGFDDIELPTISIGLDAKLPPYSRYKIT